MPPLNLYKGQKWTNTSATTKVEAAEPLLVTSGFLTGPLQPYRPLTGPLLAPYWSLTGPLLAPYWSLIGLLLAPHRPLTGLLLVPYWPFTGPLLAS